MFNLMRSRYCSEQQAVTCVDYTSLDTTEMTIGEFYKDKTIFITGATGFVGKVLIEKLLSSCPDIKVTYVLIRSKNNKSINERLEQLITDKVFDFADRVPLQLRKSKIMAVEGDLDKPKLGLSDHDWTRLCKEVNIVINSGATVNFTEPLCNALKTNCQSVVELVRLCNQMSHLVSFVHISTLYSNMQRQDIDEFVYTTRTTAGNLRACRLPSYLIEE